MQGRGPVVVLGGRVPEGSKLPLRLNAETLVIYKLSSRKFTAQNDLG